MTKFKKIRMLSKIGAISIFSACISFQSLASSEQISNAKTVLKDLDQEIEQLLSKMDIPSIAVGVVVNGEVVKAKAYGYRDVGKQLKANNKTMYPIASTSKPFTSFAAGTLVDSGQLSWDLPVSQYISDFKLYNNELTQRVTIKDMLAHRTGVPRHDYVHANYANMTRSDLVSRLPFLKPAHLLREKWDYTNIMYAVSGHILEEVSGKPFDQLMTENVLKPLGMTDTHLSIERLKTHENRAVGYWDVDNKLEVMDYYPMQMGIPAGGIVSNIDDMTLWLKANLASSGDNQTNKAINESTLKEIHKPQILITRAPIDRDYGATSYTLGWINERYKGHRILSSRGKIEGFISSVILYPYDNTGVVVLANKFTSSKVAERIARHIGNRIVLSENDSGLKRIQERHIKLKQRAQKRGKTRSEPNEKTLEPEQLKAFTGTYSHPGYGMVKISQKDRRLILWANGVDTRFMHLEKNDFVGLAGAKKTYYQGMKLSFHESDDGKINALSMPLERGLDKPIRFTKNR